MFIKVGYKMLKQKDRFCITYFIVKTRFVRDWIVSHYADKILDHYQKLDNSVSRIQFEINEIFDDKRPTNILDFGTGTKVIDLKDTNYGINRIDPRLNFENFVTGESNQLAFSAAKELRKFRIIIILYMFMEALV